MSNAFYRAVELHKQGKLDEAELIYRQTLDDNPDNADALHLLGVIAHQRGQAEKAVRFMRRAVALKPEAAVFHSNLAEAHRALGQLPDAVSHAEKAVRLEPHNADAHNHLALALQGQGRGEEAITHFREAIALRPDFALAHNNLGSALREQGRLEEALGCFREAVRLQPDLYLARSNLGQLLLELDQADEALVHCQEAVRLRPEFAEGLSNLGNVLRAQGKIDEAKECYRRALQLKPNEAMIHGNLGQALQEEGNLDEAIACYQESLRLQPQSARVETFLASALMAKERYAEAIEHYRKALQLQPDHAEARNGLGNALQEQGDLEGARVCYEEALRLKPDLAEAHVNLGGLYAELGDLEQARRCYREALNHDPNNAAAYGLLATHERGRLSEEDVAAMHALLQREHLSDWRRALLHHGLAHVYDYRGDYAAAAEHARQANACRREVWVHQGKTYHRADHTGFVRFLSKQFSPAFFERVRGWGVASELPVFVFGLPRSGTTLLEQILASHPQVFGAGELTLAKEIFDRVPRLLGREEPPAACVPHLTRSVIEQSAQEHLRRLRGLHAKALRIVDKMPDNYLWLGFLAAMFPSAKFIYSRRDVRDVAWSCWLTNFKQIRWACDWEDIAWRIICHVRLMEHWRQVLPVPMLEVSYEETVADLEGTARRMIDFIGLDWDPACVAFHQTKRVVRTASLSQVRQPIYSRSVGRWRHYADELQPLLRLLAENGITFPEESPETGRAPAERDSTGQPGGAGIG
ncbi:MAG: tetratricopeptide repeat protein [Gemmataceae bacterium]|nr:tetratricopeptide repeat protein [Gemmataceae bacterium]MDW8265576.1 tetratricopeptide repeat protein [Gemmataceae bacterium]